MSEEIRKAYTRQEMLDLATEWARQTFDIQERRHIALGMLVDFITDHFPIEQKKGQQ